MVGTMKWLLIVGLCVSVVYVQYGQSDFERAKQYINQNEYELAVSKLDNRWLLKSNPEAKFLLGVCYFQLNQLNEAIAQFDDVLDKDKDPFPEAWWYKAQILHARNEFKEALFWYKGYLKQLKDNHPHRDMVTNIIRMCSNGIQMKFKPSYTIVENLGKQVNTKYDEFAPIASPNQSNKLYFSAIRPTNTGGLQNNSGRRDNWSGKASTDMFAINQTNGLWERNESFGYRLNSNRHDLILDFNSKGNALYYYQGTSLNNGFIYIDSFQTVNNTVSTTPLVSSLDYHIGDMDPFLRQDSVIYFSSNRPGGYGGYDIYKCALEYGVWSIPENLGPTINTPYDERTPYLCNDRRTLYYSTDNPAMSLGGLDIVKTFFIPEKKLWFPPTNLGIPINSSGDDAHFRINRDGYSGYFSSSRKDGFGQRDIYLAYFETYLEENEYPLIDENTEGKSVQLSPDPFLSNDSKDPQPSNTPLHLDEELPIGQSFSDNPFSIVENWKDHDAADRLLDQLYQLMDQDLQVKLIVTANLNNSKGFFQNISSRIVSAENYAEALISKGIAPDRIVVRAICTENIDETVFSFFGNTNDHQQYPNFQELQNQGNKPWSIFESRLFYKIQVMSSSTINANSPWLDQEGAMVERQMDTPYYRYTIGLNEQFEFAETKLKEVQQSHSKDAFIVPYIDGKRLNKAEAKEWKGTFNDLAMYLN